MAQVFRDAAQFEQYFARLFAAVEEAGGMAPLSKARLLVRFDVSGPDIEMWVDGRASPVVTSFGPRDERASLTATLSGDTLHELLLGTLPLGKALSGGRLKVKGSLLKARKLEGLFHACQSLHPTLSAELLD